MSIKKIVLVVTGCISLGMGAAGAVLPVLPTVPFLLLAAICFGKSSQRLYTWFSSTELYRKHLENYVKGRGMTRRTKCRIMCITTLMMAVGFLMVGQVPAAQVLLGCVWLGHVIYFIFRVKTIPAEG